MDRELLLFGSKKGMSRRAQTKKREIDFLCCFSAPSHVNTISRFEQILCHFTVWWFVSHEWKKKQAARKVIEIIVKNWNKKLEMLEFLLLKKKLRRRLPLTDRVTRLDSLSSVGTYSGHLRWFAVRLAENAIWQILLLSSANIEFGLFLSHSLDLFHTRVFHH